VVLFEGAGAKEGVDFLAVLSMCPAAVSKLAAACGAALGRGAACSAAAVAAAATAVAVATVASVGLAERDLVRVGVQVGIHG
jgi:hypothetical protein